ncbi:MAG: hypothetical protein ABW003_02695, partial [Microvirga sp.]
RIVGPAYGFFGLGLCLYFASQGAGRLLWPILAGLLRLLVAVLGGFLVLRLTGSLPWVFAALSTGLVLYGVFLAGMVASGAWFGRPRHRRPWVSMSSQVGCWRGSPDGRAAANELLVEGAQR